MKNLKIKRSLILSIIFLLPFQLSAQENLFDAPPRLTLQDDDLEKIVQTELFPASIINTFEERRIEGTIWIKLSITNEGKLYKVVVVRGPDDQMAQETVRFVKKRLQKWIPAEKSKLTVPSEILIAFSLYNRKTSLYFFHPLKTTADYKEFNLSYQPLNYPKIAYYDVAPHYPGGTEQLKTKFLNNFQHPKGNQKSYN